MAADTKEATGEEAETASSNAASLHLPQDLSYTCSNTGVCCTTFDTIPVSQDCAAFLNDLSPAQENAIRADAGSDTEPFTAPGMPGDPPRLTRKADGSCVFYDKDHLCAVHRIIGAHAKPQVCRDFPYRYVETTGGVYVGLSFVCPSVRANAGTPLRDQEPELRTHYGVAQSILESQRKVALNRRIDLTWDEYLALESCFAELLAMEALPLGQRLIACCALVTFVDAYHQQLAGAPVAGPGNALPPGALGEFLDAMRNTRFESLLRVATRRRKTSPAVKRMFLGMFTGFANTLHRKGGRLHTITNVMVQYVRHASGLGKIRLKPIPGELTHRQIDAARLPENGSPAADLIARYVRHCIFRKDLVLSANVARRLRLLVLNVALVPWYAMAEAQQHERTQPADDDYSEAVAHVEKFYGFHSRFYRFFEDNATFDDIVEAFMLKPNYPYMLLGQ